MFLSTESAPSDNQDPSTTSPTTSDTNEERGGGTKRGLEELDDDTSSSSSTIPSTTSSNPSTSSIIPSTDSHKRLRTTHVNTTPSKVIHIRNVPLEATEAEFYTLCAPFGKVETAVIMRGKGQALVQMQDQIGATALVDFYNVNPAMLRTNLIHLQYSTREEITNKPPIHLPGASASGLFGQNPSSPSDSSSHNAPHAQPPPPGAPESANDCRVLLVNISNVQYPVTIDLLYSVFSKYGMVTKIVTFSKTGLQAFVQFSTAEGAEIAKNSLDGQNIYVGCCSLRINFSNIKDLDIKYNNDKSRDFTNQFLPRSSQAGPSEPTPAHPYYPPQQPGAPPPVYTEYQAYPPPAGYPPQSTAPSHGMPRTGMGVQAGMSPVVILSGMNEERITPDHIFTLLGVYGDVLKVKILFTKKDTALVQMATVQQAESVVTNLNSAVMFGKPIRINFSKHATIMTPSANPNDENILYTKEYLGSPLHRFRNPSNVFKHVCPPSATLHVSSIPPSVGEDELRELFSQYSEVLHVKFFTSEKRMALVQMSNAPDATTALILLHNYKFPDSPIPIRVSFAKSTIYT